MSDFQPNIAIVEEFKEAFGVSGLGNGDFTKELTLDGANSAVAVTVANIATDRYSATYTPNAAGLWGLRVWKTSDPSVKYHQSRKVRSSDLAAVVEIEGSYTLQQAMSIVLAALAGRTTDDGLTFKTPNNAATRIAATVNTDNERTGITLTPSA